MSINLDLMQIYPLFTDLWDLVNSHNAITYIVTGIAVLLILNALRGAAFSGGGPNE